jgi:predicted AAA+ superfamily ATPase
VKDLFVYLVQASGSIFDAAKRSRDLEPEADPRSVREWVRMLENTLLVSSLKRHTNQPSARLRSKPRIYATDHGLISSFAASPHEEGVRSMVFEAVVYRHLRETAKYLNGELSYFRHEKKKLEVDFIFREDRKRVAVEVTNSMTPKGDKIENLHEVGEIIRTKHLLLVYGGIPEAKKGNVRLVPITKFLLNPVSYFE